MSKEIITKSAIESFKSAWTNGMNNILKACKIYVEAIDNDETQKEKFREAFPQISNVAWARIESTGRGAIHHLLLCDSSPIAPKLRKLPFSEQKQALENGIEYLTSKGDVLKIKTQNLLPEQIAQVMAGNHIRDIAEQRAWIETQKNKNSIEVEYVPPKQWHIHHRCLYVGAVKFNRQQLEEILEQLG